MDKAIKELNNSKCLNICFVQFRGISLPHGLSELALDFHEKKQKTNICKDIKKT